MNEWGFAGSFIRKMLFPPGALTISKCGVVRESWKKESNGGRRG
jgi:hypothetical protein